MKALNIFKFEMREISYVILIEDTFTHVRQNYEKGISLKLLMITLLVNNNI